MSQNAPAGCYHPAVSPFGSYNLYDVVQQNKGENGGHKPQEENELGKAQQPVFADNDVSEVRRTPKILICIRLTTKFKKRFNWPRVL